MVSLMSFPKMMFSESDGWLDIVRLHPSAKRWVVSFVVPMSVLPALMYGYSAVLQNGVVFPQVEPTLSVMEATIVGGLFVFAEVAMVGLMAVFVQQICKAVNISASRGNALALAAIAPTPLWLSSLALFVPSLGFNLLVVLAAWIGSIALIRHGIRPLIAQTDEKTIQWITNVLTFVGVVAWITLMIVLALISSMVLGFR